MADDCCDSFGGRISIMVDGAPMTPSEADITLDPTNIEVEGKANQDGSACFTSKPKLYGADVKFRNGCGIRWDDKLRKCKIDATIIEEDNSRTHIFTGARFTGKPTLNLSTGEIDGIKIEGSRYQALST
jgi:hypothetical protein